jgi:predicted AAA+ superfamily ATPase
MKKYIKRNIYWRKVKPFVDKDLVKIIVGQRRVGKSYFMLQIMDEIKKIHPRANIIYINKESYDFVDIYNDNKLMRAIKKQEKKGDKNYLFIDEVQEITDWQKVVRSLNATGRFDIYCSGSNADLLSGELATLLAGRYVEIDIYSLSYKEFLQFHKLDNNKISLQKYWQFGGLPYLIHLDMEEDIVYDYLKNIYNSILLKDVVSRYNVRNVSFLEQLTQYLADNTGSFISSSRISKFLKNQKVEIHNATVLEYLTFLAKTFFVAEANRKDIFGKKVFVNNPKYYFQDLGLRNVIVGYRLDDISKILENLVYNHLRILGYKVNVGKLDEYEIDFVAEKKNEKVYIQVAYKINENNNEREFGNLLRIDDNYQKMVISTDDFIGKNTYQGIKHWHLEKFLTEFK